MQKMPEIMKTDEARRVVRNYNRIQEVLLEFEMMYHGGWLRGLAAASQCKFPNLRSREAFSECVFFAVTVRTLTITRAIHYLHTCIPSTALLVPVLIRHPIRKDVVANFDPIIYQLIRETEVMKKMGLDIPDEGQRLLYMQKGLKEKHSKLVVSYLLG